MASNPSIKKRRKKRKKRSRRPSGLTDKEWRSLTAKRAWKKRKARERKKAKTFRAAQKAWMKAHPELKGISVASLGLQGIIDAEVKKQLDKLVPEMRSQVRADFIEMQIAEATFVDSNETRVVGRLLLAYTEGRILEEIHAIADDPDMDRPDGWETASEIYTQCIYMGLIH